MMLITQKKLYNALECTPEALEADGFSTPWMLSEALAGRIEEHRELEEALRRHQAKFYARRSMKHGFD